MSDTVIDNDVLIKASAFGLLGETAQAFGGSMGILGVARFAVPKQIAHHPRILDPTRALSNWSKFVEVAEELEPTADELALATAIEAVATERGLQLDIGESQLCAIAIHRSVSRLISGDKRAAIAAETLIGQVAELGGLAGLWVCLEQLVATLATRIGLDLIRERVCAEPGVDTALTICMSCGATEHQAAAGLASYVADLRSLTPTVLVSDADLARAASQATVTEG